MIMTYNEKRLKYACINLISQIKNIIKEIEITGLTNEQWFIDFEDKLNELSIKDHNADQNS